MSSPGVLDQECLFLIGLRKDGTTTTVTCIYFNQILALVYTITEFILWSWDTFTWSAKIYRILSFCITWILIGVEVGQNSKLQNLGASL